MPTKTYNFSRLMMRSLLASLPLAKSMIRGIATGGIGATGIDEDKINSYDFF